MEALGVCRRQLSPRSPGVLSSAAEAVQRVTLMEQAPVPLILVAVYKALKVQQLLLGLLPLQLQSSNCEMNCAVDNQRFRVSAGAAQCNPPLVPGQAGDFLSETTSRFHHLAEQARAQLMSAGLCCMFCFVQTCQSGAYSYSGHSAC
mmetsp:Transcript_103823/g.201239  ORF Transcript_103823/g.201239 Transcript_103823/m.201239 type:complete len:147 (+) Transcript_103823:693-1133(+)